MVLAVVFTRFPLPGIPKTNSSSSTPHQTRGYSHGALRNDSRKCLMPQIFEICVFHAYVIFRL